MGGGERRLWGGLRPKTPPRPAPQEPADPLDKNYSATKCVATIGPTSKAVDVLVQMLESGMSAARWVGHVIGPVRSEMHLARRALHQCSLHACEVAARGH